MYESENKIYMDQTGSFFVTYIYSNKYIMVAYQYTWNSVDVGTMKNRTAG